MIVQGGDTVKQKTARILKSLLTWHVAKQFSWFGAKGKKKYSDLNICKLMCSKYNLTFYSIIFLVYVF